MNDVLVLNFFITYCQQIIKNVNVRASSKMHCILFFFQTSNNAKTFCHKSF